MTTCPSCGAAAEKQRENLTRTHYACGRYTYAFDCSALVSLAARWREDAARHRVSCRLHEGHGDRGRADRHYQRSLDLDACAASLETELRAWQAIRNVRNLAATDGESAAQLLARVKEMLAL